VFSSEVLPAKISTTNRSVTEKHNTGIIYYLQIGAFSNPLDESYFKGLGPVREESVGNGDVIKYMVGAYTKFSKAKNEVYSLRQKFPNAFIIAYKNGVKYNLTKAKFETDGDKEPYDTFVKKKSDFISSGEEIYFKVRVAVFAKEVSQSFKDNFAEFNKFGVEYTEDWKGQIVCTVGKEKKYTIISKLKMKLRANGFGEAFTVAYQGEKRIKVQDALEIMRSK